MLRRLALEPAYTVDRARGGKLEPIFASDSYRECLAAFEAAAEAGGEVVLRYGVRVLRSGGAATPSPRLRGEGWGEGPGE